MESDVTSVRLLSARGSGGVEQPCGASFAQVRGHLCNGGPRRADVALSATWWWRQAWEESLGCLLVWLVPLPTAGGHAAYVLVKLLLSIESVAT